MGLFKSSSTDFSVSSRQIPPSKRGKNVVIGFDTVNKQVRILALKGLDWNSGALECFDYNGQFLSDEFLAEFADILSRYLKLTSLGGANVYLALPDNCVAMDDISLPALSKRKLQETLATELQKFYKSYKDLQFRSMVASSNKQNVVYCMTIVRKQYLSNMYSALSAKRINPKFTSFTSNCTVNCALQFRSSLRKKNFILLDVKEDRTNIAYVLKGHTASFAQVMLGTQHLSDKEVLQENTLYDHDVADLAILNAKERAKMKALTVDVDENQIVSAEGDLNNMEQALSVDDTVTQVLSDNPHAEANTVQQAVSEIVNPDDDQEEEEVEELQPVQPVKKQKVFVRKQPKKLPKFMLRPTPETAEGIVYENFRMIMKWALLYKSKLERIESLPRIDSVVVNIDSNLQFVVDMANKENFNTFELLTLPQPVSRNMDLVGALFTGMFNKHCNL